MYYTTIGKTITCPCFNESVTLTGKYRITDNSTTISFLTAYCPIIENSKLPPYDQSESYKYLKCNYQNGCCDLNSHFEATIEL